MILSFGILNIILKSLSVFRASAKNHFVTINSNNRNTMFTDLYVGAAFINFAKLQKVSFICAE